MGAAYGGAASPLLAAPSGQRDGGVRALFPVLDLLNHKSTARTTLYKRAHGGWEVVSRDAYSAGEQVWVTYGPRDNLKVMPRRC